MMRISERIKGSVVISWGCLVTILILYGVQTKTVNKTMWVFSVVIPLLLYIPLLLPAYNQRTIFYQKSMVLISIIFFGLTLVAAAMNPDYVNFVRWGILALSIVGIVLNAVIYKEVKWSLESRHKR